MSFLGGSIVAYVAVVAVMFWSMSAKAHGGDGGMAMAIMFAIGPLGGIVGGTVAAIAIPIWLNRRDRDRAEAGTRPKRWPPKVRAAIAAAAWGAAAYLLMLLAFWLFVAGTSFKSYGPRSPWGSPRMLRALPPRRWPPCWCCARRGATPRRRIDACPCSAIPSSPAGPR